MEHCHFCGNKNIKATYTQYTYKHNGKFLIIENVPCDQCEYCGEQYFNAKVLKQIENEFIAINSGQKKTAKQIIVPTESFEDLASA